MSHAPLSPQDETKLGAFARRLINQDAARVVVAPQQAAAGFWFGGGNMIEGADGALYLVGRYRNAGDSRTGVAAGERGLELAIFRSDDRGGHFEKIVHFDKRALDVDDRSVLSIEGSALWRSNTGIELFVSTEKTNVRYPLELADYLKPGTGVWTIDRLAADTVIGLSGSPVRTVLESVDSSTIHYKDPFVFNAADGSPTLFWCTHPYCWSSSNTALAVRGADGSFGPADTRFFPRGNTWDVAITRGTCVLDVPRVGAFAERQVSLVFYDGGECLRNHDEHAGAVRRPRGYSCEEIGGVAYVLDHQWHNITRLTREQAWFVSPRGTGCSRYVDVLATGDGYYATWQQSQDDLSQPLVMNVIDREQAEALLA
ncbi:MAG: hypothetical protein R3C10_25985 [Pirellulales bacterium]